MAQIGTIKVETQNNGTVSVPIFDTGDSGSSVYEFVRVQTAGGTGFIPVVDTADASFPYLRVQSQNQGVVAVHNEASLAPPEPSSGVFRWTCKNGNNNTSVVEDVWNNGYDGTVTNATYNAIGGNDGAGAYEDDCDIEVNVDGMSGANSFAGWFYAPWSSGSGNRVVWNYEDNGREFGIHYNNRQNSTGYELLIADDSLGSNRQNPTQQWVHLVGTYNGSGNAKIYIDGNRENSGSGLSDPSPNSDPLYISQAPNEGKDNNLRIAEFAQYNKELSDTEVSNLYNTGSING